MDLRSHEALRPLAGLVNDLQRAVPDVNWLLVGAMARDLHLRYARNIRLLRATHDVDFGVAVSGWTDFDALLLALVSAGNFKRGRALHRLTHQAGIPVDLVPYGGVEAPGRELHWPPDGSDQMHVIGYSEARSTAEIAILPGDVRIAVPTLAGLLILKFFAFRGRGHVQGSKDASDIYQMLRHYMDNQQSERLFEEFSDLLREQDFEFDYRTAGAYMAGSDARLILGDGHAWTELRHIVVETLDGASAGAMAREVRENRKEFRELLVAFSRGLHRC